MLFNSGLVVGLVSLTMGHPTQFPRGTGQGLGVAPSASAPASSLTPSQLLVCQAFDKVGQAGAPATGVPSYCSGLVADPIPAPNSPSDSSGSTTGVNLPIDGAGGLANVPAGVLGGLGGLGGLFAREKAARRQVSGSTTGGGGLDLGEGGVPGFVTGLASVPEATSVLTGVAGSLPGLLGTVQGLGGILAREVEGIRSKSRRALDALTGVVGGLPFVGGLLGGVTGAIPTPGAGTPGTPSLTGGLPVVGSGGLSGLSGLARRG